jgi:hypothetical protein
LTLPSFEQLHTTLSSPPVVPENGNNQFMLLTPS